MIRTPTEDRLVEQLHRLADHARTNPTGDQLPTVDVVGDSQRPARPLLLAAVVALFVVIAGVVGVAVLGSEGSNEKAGNESVPGTRGSLRVERTRVVGNGPLVGGTERVVIEFNEPLPVDKVEYVSDITTLDPASGILFTTQGPATTRVCDSVHSVPDGAVGSVDVLIPANWFADDRAHAGPPPETVDAPAKFVVCGPHNGFIQYAVWAPLAADPADVTVTVSSDRTSLTILTAS